MKIYFNSFSQEEFGLTAMPALLVALRDIHMNMKIKEASM